MSRNLRIFKSLILPVGVTIIVPYLIIFDRLDQIIVYSVMTWITFSIGLMLIMLGLVFLTVTIKSFWLIGEGTLVPWDSPKKLVVTGMYSYVRNPMISGVLIILLGEALALRSIQILLWFFVFFVINNVYFTVIEEPDLIRKFGKDYLLYRKNVPKWIPRTTPWEK